METTTARFVIQRRKAADGEWEQVAVCNSLDYARIVSTAGLRLQVGLSYRVVHTRTGKTFVLRSPTAAGAGASPPGC
jgi:hypothetical protein